MIDVQYPINGFNDAHEVIEEARRTGRQIRDILGNGFPEDWTQEQLIDAYLREECTIGYLAARLHMGLVETRRLLQERTM